MKIWGRIALIVLLFLALSLPCYAVNTTVVSGSVIQITGLDADWYLANTSDSSDLSEDKVTSGLLVDYIIIVPSAANDRVVIRNSKTANGNAAAFLDTGAIQDTEARMWKPINPRRIWPFIDIGDCTFNNAANAKIIIGFQ